jgi:predicted ATPase
MIFLKMSVVRLNSTFETKKIMTSITAIEVENFQSIERRTRIELKPITLLYGPNSAGKSSIFDALELLQVVLDPTKFDQTKAANMLNRWARHKDANGWRQTFLAVEFPYDFEKYGNDVVDIWKNPENWPNGTVKKTDPCFWFAFDYEEHEEKKGATVRIEVTLKVINNENSNNCFLSEFNILLDGVSIISLATQGPHGPKYEEQLANVNSQNDYGYRWLTINEYMNFEALEFKAVLSQKNNPRLFTKHENGHFIHDWIKSNSLDPKTLSPADATVFMWGYFPEREMICINASDISFYFGTLFGTIFRNSPCLVNSDRRAPGPEEVLTIVDLGLRGWWDESDFSPSSPSFLFRTTIKKIDPHYQGLAEVAHADVIVKTANDSFWGGTHAASNIRRVDERASILARVNHHLEKSLFTDKLYRLTSASTLMVPIDLREDDPWGFYALAQPAAVRLFLQDATGQKIDLQDVGSGVPFALPVLYAVCKQGFVSVQQPELHLHPALQSSLADVFIEEANREGFGQFIIETHSEHFLLRLLRRIKSTTKKTCLTDELRLSNEDVSIYYFDPQVEGGTFVTRQLVTPLGDFYNDWPRGFFSERNVDLFDE